MKVQLLPSSPSGVEDGVTQYMTSFLLNDTVAIDAGSLGFFLSPAEQAQVKHLFITHTHIDHIASLPLFLENVYRSGDHVVTVHGSEAVLDCLHRDIFNDRVWPDFIRLTSEGVPFLRVMPLHPGTPVEVEGLRITPVPVDHPVPTLGFIVEDAAGAVVFSADTGPTEELWRRAAALPNLKAVFLEATFPNAMADLAQLTKHHTPASFAAETRKIRPGVPLFAFHLKARFAGQVAKELAELGMANLSIMHPGRVYSV